MQKGFLINKLEKQRIQDACEYINYAAELLRAKGGQVIHVKDIEGIEIKDANELEFIDDIKIVSSDNMITKIDSNAFWNTDLENILREGNPDLVVVSGYAAEYCVLSTYNGSKERGFNTVILQHGILSRKDEAITSIYRERDVISYPAIEALVG